MGMQGGLPVGYENETEKLFKDALKNISSGKYLSYTNSRFSPEQQSEINKAIIDKAKSNQITNTSTATQSAATTLPEVDIPDYAISDEQKNALLNDRLAQLTVAGQRAGEKYGDSRSGYQGAMLRGSQADIEGRAANLPIETELEVAEANRKAKLEKLAAQRSLMVSPDLIYSTENQNTQNQATMNYLTNQENIINAQTANTLAEQNRLKLIEDFRKSSGATSPVAVDLSNYRNIGGKAVSPVNTTNAKAVNRLLLA